MPRYCDNFLGSLSSSRKDGDDQHPPLLMVMTHFCELHGPSCLFVTQEVRSASCESLRDKIKRADPLTTQQSSEESPTIENSDQLSPQELLNKLLDQKAKSANAPSTRNHHHVNQGGYPKSESDTHYCEGCSLTPKSYPQSLEGFISDVPASESTSSANKRHPADQPQQNGKPSGYSCKIITSRYPIEDGNQVKNIVKHACVRALSCETYNGANGREGIIYFGDPVRGHVMSYMFSLKDSQARGFRRTYAILIITHHKGYLMQNWDFFEATLEQLVTALKKCAERVYDAELQQTTFHQKRAMRLDSVSHIGTPSVHRIDNPAAANEAKETTPWGGPGQDPSTPSTSGAGAESDPNTSANLQSPTTPGTSSGAYMTYSIRSDRNPYATHRGAVKARSLIELVHDAAIFAHLHQQFGWLMVARRERVITVDEWETNPEWKSMTSDEPPLRLCPGWKCSGSSSPPPPPQQLLSTPSTSAEECDSTSRLSTTTVGTEPEQESCKRTNCSPAYVLRHFYPMVGRNKFLIMAYHALIGNQIIVRCESRHTTENLINFIAQVLPADCVKRILFSTKYEDTLRCNFLGLDSSKKDPNLVPKFVLDSEYHLLIDVALRKTDSPTSMGGPEPGSSVKSEATEPVSRSVRSSTSSRDLSALLSGLSFSRSNSRSPPPISSTPSNQHWSITLHSRCKVPDKLPRYLIHIDGLIQNITEYSDAALDQALLSAKTEWINRAKMVYSCTKGQIGAEPRSEKEMQVLYRALHIQECDLKLINFWMCKGLTVSYKTQVFSLYSGGQHGVS